MVPGRSMTGDVAHDGVAGQRDESDPFGKRSLRMVFAPEIRRHPDVGGMNRKVHRPTRRHRRHVGVGGRSEPEIVDSPHSATTRVSRESAAHPVAKMSRASESPCTCVG
jgi:hypothetical protein